MWKGVRWLKEGGVRKSVGAEEGALLKRKSASRESIGDGSESAVWGSVNTINIAYKFSWHGVNTLNSAYKFFLGIVPMLLILAYKFS